MKADLIFKDVKDDYVRENFTRIQNYFNDDTISKGQWKHFDLEFTTAVTNRLVPHRLPYKPLDLIQTFKTGAGNITFNYSAFSDENISITTTGACRVRFFLGRFNVEL